MRKGFLNQLRDNKGKRVDREVSSEEKPFSNPADEAKMSVANVSKEEDEHAGSRSPAQTLSLDGENDDPARDENGEPVAAGKKPPIQFGGVASGIFSNAKNGGLVINEHWLTDPAKRNSVMRAVRKRINRPGNRANADAVRAKWARLLDTRPQLYSFWRDLVNLGKHKELLKLELHLLEKELLATDQKEVMLAVMAQFVAGAPACCDEILDGFEVTPGKTPSIWWRDGDRMISMTLMRLHKLMITRNDHYHLDIVDQWDKESEDQDILVAWEERARSWNMEDTVLEKAKEWKLKSVEKDRVNATELLLRDFVGYVYVVQANRLIAYHKAVMLEEEVLAEERSKERKQQKKAAKRQQRKDKLKTADPAPDDEPEESEVTDARPGAGEGGGDWYSFARARRQVLAERIVRRQRHLAEMCKPKAKSPPQPGPVPVTGKHPCDRSGTVTTHFIYSLKACDAVGGTCDQRVGFASTVAPFRHVSDVLECREEEEEPMDEWQTFDEVLAEIKKEIGNYKTPAAS